MKEVGPILREGKCRRRAARLVAAACLLAAATVPAFAARNWPQDTVTRDFNKTLTLNSGQSVRIEHKFGEIKVHGEAGREVKIYASIRAQASSHDEAQSFADKIQIIVEQDSSGISIRTVYPDEKSWFHSSKHSSWSVSYDVGMPSDAPLNARNSYGSVEVTRVHGALDIENGFGSLTIRDAGPVRLTNSFGSIELTGAAGNSVVNNKNSSVQIADVKGTLDTQNRFGSITVHNIEGAVTINGGNGAVTLADAPSATVTTSFGNVDARNVRGDLSIHDNNGNVDVSTIGGSLNISDSFGNVTFTDVKGHVDCTDNNGRIAANNLAGAAVTLRDSFGNLDLENISGSLDAKTSNGKVTVRDARGNVTLESSFGAIEASNIPKGIRAITGNGAITLTDIGADAYAKTSFGAILAERINGNFTAEDSNGSVTARNVRGDASVNTSFSGVTLESVGGKIRVDNQNGGIYVTANRSSNGCRDIALKTSFSAIRVRVPDGVGYNLSAHTSFGRITSELPVTASGNIGGDSLNGMIGAGGCQLQLNNSNGSIEIAKAP
jgi:hypothetical protein